MKLHEIRDMPTSIGSNHESLYRSYHILEKVKSLLEVDPPVSHSVILEIVNDLEHTKEKQRERSYGL
jgi:hypothetical protein